MDFDPALIAVPFRMQPGLSRLDEGAVQLTPLDPSGRLFEEKRRVAEAAQSRHAAPGFDPAPALAAIAREGRRLGHEPSALPPELAWEEDFAVLDGAAGTIPWICACVPSHWAPEEKAGLPFAALHAPVADAATLVAASAHLVKLATSGRWERHVWTLSPSSRFDQHPHRHGRTAWPAAQDPEAFAAACWLRAERQTFFPVGEGSRQSVFTIRVMLEPLPVFAAEPGAARRLHDSLASMTDAVLAYKGLAEARPRLLRWLSRQAGEEET
ncbi:MAG: heme-dependent oxidative N-demethylase subunit alpha family protein [Burkholderiaceae bacterium]